MVFANWIGLIILGVVLLCVSWALRKPGAPSVPPILLWVCDVLGAICLVVGIILGILSVAGVHT